MWLQENEIYHVFNRGNNKQDIFLTEDNYPYFLSKVQRWVVPCCDLLAWCLMPNHFHFLIHANQYSIQEIKDGSFSRQRFSQNIKQLLSSYTKAVNKQMGRTGHLFQQKTKAKCVSENNNEWPETAFHYIHQNPMRAGLVSRLEDWPYSSFSEYLNQNKGGMCNQSLARQILNINFNRIYEESYEVLREVSYT